MDLTTGLILILIAVLVAGFAWFGRLLRARNETMQGVNPQGLMLLQNQVAQLQKELGDRMGETHQAVRQQFAASTTIVRDVTERMTRMEEMAKQVLDVTGQLQQLQDILKNPKHRGILGEYYLETLLLNVLPPDSYCMQYKFGDGEVVDAVVFVKDKIVPIDSKFSLENYNRLVGEQNPAEQDRLEKLFVNDLKERIKETAKYIRPEEGTMEFAFMFIPHDAIYYDLLINKIGVVGEDTESLVQRAASKYRVIIVSPTSFFAYLQTVLQGLKALKIEEQAKEIRVRVGDLGRHLAAYEQYFNGIGKNLKTTMNQYQFAAHELTKIDKDVIRITGETPGLKPLLIDKPENEEEQGSEQA